MLVERQIDGEDGGRDHRNEGEITVQQPTCDTPGNPHPQRREDEQQRHDGDIARHGEIERKSMEEDQHPVAQAEAVPEDVTYQKKRLQRRHQQDRSDKDGEEEKEFALHFRRGMISEDRECLIKNRAFRSGCCRITARAGCGDRTCNVPQ